MEAALWLVTFVSAGTAIELRGRCHQLLAFGMAGGKRREPPAEGREPLGRHGDTRRHHAPAIAGERCRGDGAVWDGFAPAALERCVPSSTACPAALGEPSPLT